MADVTATGGDATSSSSDAAVSKRYEGLVAIRTKAVRGKGAWYWAHLEPVLIRSPDSNLAKAVKLRCNLCDASFSASNPSRTATEHLKRGACPNFSSVLRPISQLPPLASPTSQNHHKKRSLKQADIASSTSYLSEMAVVNHHHQQEESQVVLSGGKEDLGALALLEDSVKKLKSPKQSSSPSLKKEQIDSALNLLADWFYESCGSVSFSCLEHPKFKSFLNQVGLPPVSRKEFFGANLDSKFERARTESEARINEAAFFQVASDGWKSNGVDNVIKFMVNLPNGSRVFHKAVYKDGLVPSQYAEEVLWETIEAMCGNAASRCVGIVADKYRAKALRNLEIKNSWMVNLSCLFQGFVSLIKDFSRELPLFNAVIDNCLKIANLFNSVRSHFHKFRSHGVDIAGLIRVPSPHGNMSKNFDPYLAMLEDIRGYARILQLVVIDDLFKTMCSESSVAREVAEMVQDVGFWNEAEAVYSLVKMIKEMAKEIELERPLIGQCLPLWEGLRSKMKEWCAKFSIAEEQVDKIVERRFKKTYHPAWSAAFVLDPLYLMRDSTGKYLPPFKCLSPEQEKDVDSLITRLVSRDEAPVVLMELMKWRTEGLDPLYAQAVQVKQRDPLTGRMKVANPQSSRLVWETCLKEFRSLGRVAVRLVFLHATSCGIKCNWSFMRWICLQGHSRAGLDRAQRMIFIAAHAKLERGDVSSEEEKDAEAFAGEDDEMLNEVFVDA